MDDIQEQLSSPSSPNQQLLSVDEEIWMMAEERAQEILYTIQPNVISEVNRQEVIDYVQRLIRGYYGAEAFPFGSVPLKTYLPDGDIDLTALTYESTEEDLALAVCRMLENGAHSEYEVKDVQHIRAQVQLVKCTVKNIAVDISFNQMAGLYALRFLEQIDELVGKDHLFKRSIILIKAWCYYESRILGAHHGLLSTYAVETLVLYIINRFHSSVRGPLEVLYRFLDYYSTFDWEHHYVSVDGPKALSSLPVIIETPECERGEFLLNKEFLRNYRDMCSASARAMETVTHEFPIKPMNILDPLRNDNNLGRSVSRGNLHRIRFALSFGARKLKDILTLPEVCMVGEIEKFFVNTLDRNGKGVRPDVQVPVPAFGTGRSEKSDLRGDCDSYYGGLQYAQLLNYTVPHTALTISPSLPSQSDMHVPHTAHTISPSLPSQSEMIVPHTAHSISPSLSAQSEMFVPHIAHSISPSLSSQSDMFVPHNGYSISPPLSSQSDMFVPHTAHPISPSPPSQADILVPHTAYPISSSSSSQADMLALSTQQNCYMFYQTGTDVYVPIPRQTLYHPNASQATYCLEERGKSRGTGPYIPDTHNTYWDLHVRVTRPRRFPHAKHNALPHSPQRKQQQVEVHSETDMNGNSKSFELSNEEFPVLQSILKTCPSEAKMYDKLTDQAGSPSSPQLNIDFGTYSNSASLTELSLPTKDKKEDSGVSSSEGTMQVVPRVEMEMKEEFHVEDEKMD
ncbi:uncharacterized protein LOC133311053 isoform X2 [Gastrolobium bilobum]|uniref:uncharacterized protein LOC133311053 isoform X2 n=1 Tax=Gastrolobium bilobum TaxID=150636 RepID=UPI002AB19ED3|nr:uncharacterized protein LOC133311053 isoform X2 [Gastrolobium bilobum]